MLRTVIQIDESKCNGCGICADACHEGAIAIIGGKARLTRDDYCDGMGDCLPACPTDAISFIEREAAAYDSAAVAANKRRTWHTPEADAPAANPARSSMSSPPSRQHLPLPPQSSRSFAIGPSRSSSRRCRHRTSTEPTCSSRQIAARTPTATSTPTS